MLMTDGYLTMIPGYWLALPALPVAWWIWRHGRGRGRGGASVGGAAAGGASAGGVSAGGAPGQVDRRWTFLALLALAHVTVVVALTIFPIPISGQDYYRHTRGLSQDNVIPFATITDQLIHLRLGTIRQLVGNSIVFMPLAVYGPGLWPRLRDWRWFAAVAIAFTVAIELGQLAGSILEGFTYRVTDVDDAIMNASGAVAAFFLWRWAERRDRVRGWLARFGLGEDRASVNPGQIAG